MFFFPSRLVWCVCLITDVPSAALRVQFKTLIVPSSDVMFSYQSSAYWARNLCRIQLRVPAVWSLVAWFTHTRHRKKSLMHSHTSSVQALSSAGPRKYICSILTIGRAHPIVRTNGMFDPRERREQTKKKKNAGTSVIKLDVSHVPHVRLAHWSRVVDSTRTQKHERSSRTDATRTRNTSRRGLSARCALDFRVSSSS